MERLLKFYINGEWVAPPSSETMPVVNPATAGQVAEIALGNEADECKNSRPTVSLLFTGKKLIDFNRFN